MGAWDGRPGKLDVSSLQGETRGTEGSRHPSGRPQTPGPPTHRPQRRGTGARAAGVLGAPSGLTSSPRAGGAGQFSPRVCIASASQRNSAREHVFQEFPQALEGACVPQNRLLKGSPHTGSAQVMDSPGGQGLAEKGGQAPRRTPLAVILDTLRMAGVRPRLWPRSSPGVACLLYMPTAPAHSCHTPYHWPPPDWTAGTCRGALPSRLSLVS